GRLLGADDLEDGVDGRESEAPEDGREEGGDDGKDQAPAVGPGAAQGTQEVLHSLPPGPGSRKLWVVGRSRIRQNPRAGSPNSGEFGYDPRPTILNRPAGCSRIGPAGQDGLPRPPRSPTLAEGTFLCFSAQDLAS